MNNPLWLQWMAANLVRAMGFTKIFLVGDDHHFKHYALLLLCFYADFITICRFAIVAFVSPVLWQLCWHWWGSADTSYRMPSSASSGSPSHPVNFLYKEKSTFLAVHSHLCMQFKTVQGIKGGYKEYRDDGVVLRRPHLPGAALRWLGQMPQDHVVGTLQWVDDYLLTRKKK